MTDSISLTGRLGADPEHRVLTTGTVVADFRLATSRRKFDTESSRWIDIDTNWYTVTAFGQLAQNVASSLHKGDQVVVSGRVKLEQWERNGRSGTAVQVVADAVGPDLRWGTARYARSSGSGAAQAVETSQHGPSDPGAETIDEWATSSLGGSADSGASDGEQNPASTDDDARRPVLVGADTAEVATPF